jgi:hypothetical protein
MCTTVALNFEVLLRFLTTVINLPASKDPFIEQGIIVILVKTI